MIPTVIRFKMVHMYKILLQIVTIKFGQSLQNSEDNVMVCCQQCGTKKLAMLQDSTWQRKNLVVVEDSPFIHKVLLK
jgi:5-methylcytosine-specific restriction endonuclease McrA